jgi:ATP-dependent DNA helicase DinG
MSAQETEPQLNKEKILKLIQEEGLLGQALKGFETRRPQQQMMENIIDAYNQNTITLIEAGTGTGKSLAYLIPALIWAARYGERTVISTHTIHLQEQLVHKDIPLLADALNIKLKAVLVKGMNNYICLRKLADAQTELRLFASQESQEIQKIDLWQQTTAEGSRSDLSFTPSQITWDKVGAESDACARNECPYFQQCFFFKARRQANEAKILVVNHHLLFADLCQRKEKSNYNDPGVLPPYKRIIIDEAHHIEEIATEYFAARLHRLEVNRLLNRLLFERSNQPLGKLPLLKAKLQTLFHQTPPRHIQQILNRLSIDLPAQRYVLNEHLNRAFDNFLEFMDHIKQPLAELFQEEVPTVDQKLRMVKEHWQHPKWQTDVRQGVIQLSSTLRQYSHSLHHLENDLKEIDNDRLQEQTRGIRLDIQALAIRLDHAAQLLDHFIKETSDLNKVRWIEAHKLKTLVNIHLIDADLDISQALVQSLFSKFPTIILCSATLTTNQRFDFIRQRLGLTHSLLAERTITEHCYESSFNYPKQALLVVPLDMPFPSDPAFNQASYNHIWKAIQASQGNAFILFTSYTMLQQCYEAMNKKFEENRYSVFKQGDESRQSLLSKFKKTERAILLGTDSFWEGVDVAGDALRCVIIVKLPFKVPTEPIIQARTEAIIARGGDPFYEYSVPQAIVKFKQGFGRLIRNKWDRGCIVCLDTRLVTKSYGRLFLNSLPPCEKFFTNGESIWQKMADFYKKTYYFVKNSPISNG